MRPADRFRRPGFGWPDRGVTNDAMAEAFRATLKARHSYRHAHATRVQVHKHADELTDMSCTRQRIHTTPDTLNPVEHEPAPPPTHENPLSNLSTNQAGPHFPPINNARNTPLSQATSHANNTHPPEPPRHHPVPSPPRGNIFDHKHTTTTITNPPQPATPNPPEPPTKHCTPSHKPPPTTHQPNFP